MLHIALQSECYHFFSLCRSPVLNVHSGIVAKSDHTSEWVYWICACIENAMRLVTLQKSLLAFRLSVRKMQFSHYKNLEMIPSRQIYVAINNPSFVLSVPGLTNSSYRRKFVHATDDISKAEN